VNDAGASSAEGAAVVSVAAVVSTTAGAVSATLVRGVLPDSSPAQAARRATLVSRGRIRRDGTRRVWQAE
jgi:hypothetical protein